MMDDEALTAEIERTMMEYSESWEGHVEELTPLGAGVARWNGWSGFAFPRFDGPDADEQLHRAIDDLEGAGRRYVWVVSPSARPLNLPGQLDARGFNLTFNWDGLVLEDLCTSIEVNPEVTVEEPSYALAEEVGELWEICTEGTAGRDFVAESIRRYVRAEPKETAIFLGRLDGRIVSYTSTRFEPNGTAYLRQGATHPDFQQRRLYLTLLQRRLEAARQAGSTRAVVQAIATTSSTILQKRGFRKVCGLSGYTRPPAAE